MVALFNKMGRWRIIVWLIVILVLLKFIPLSKLLFLLTLFGIGEIFWRERQPESLWRIIALAHLAVGASSLVTFSTDEIIFLAVIAVVTDTFALYGGKFMVMYLGKVFRIFPKTSPNKTWGGTLCGIFAGTLAGLLAAYYLNLSYVPSPWWLLVRSVAQSVIGIGGDWVNSKFKRVYNIKDSGEDLLTGKLSCGHGGVYDRMDNFLAQASFHFLLKLFF